MYKYVIFEYRVYVFNDKKMDLSNVRDFEKAIV